MAPCPQSGGGCNLSVPPGLQCYPTSVTCFTQPLQGSVNVCPRLAGKVWGRSAAGATRRSRHRQGSSFRRSTLSSPPRCPGALGCLGATTKHRVVGVLQAERLVGAQLVRHLRAQLGVRLKLRVLLHELLIPLLSNARLMSLTHRLQHRLEPRGDLALDKRVHARRVEQVELLLPRTLRHLLQLLVRIAAEQRVSVSLGLLPQLRSLLKAASRFCPQLTHQLLHVRRLVLDDLVPADLLFVGRHLLFVGLRSLRLGGFPRRVLLQHRIEPLGPTGLRRRRLCWGCLRRRRLLQRCCGLGYCFF